MRCLKAGRSGVCKGYALRTIPAFVCGSTHHGHERGQVGRRNCGRSGRTCRRWNEISQLRKSVESIGSPVCAENGMKKLPMEPSVEHVSIIFCVTDFSLCWLRWEWPKLACFGFTGSAATFLRSGGTHCSSSKSSRHASVQRLMVSRKGCSAG